MNLHPNFLQLETRTLESHPHMDSTFHEICLCFVEFQLHTKWQPGRILEESHDHFLVWWFFSTFKGVGN